MTTDERISALEKRIDAFTQALALEAEEIRSELAALKAQPAEVKWPVWVPNKLDEYFFAESGSTYDAQWSDSVVAKARLALANVYRTEAEAQARCELNPRLAIHAMLRQLGGGDEGGFVVRRYFREWCVISAGYLSPGDALFTTKEAAESALAALKSAGVLKDGEVK